MQMYERRMDQVDQEAYRQTIEQFIEKAINCNQFESLLKHSLSRNQEAVI